MARTNRFNVKQFKENIITVEEEKKNRSPSALFFIKNGKLIFAISFLFSITVFIIAVALAIFNVKDSSVVYYESNGVMVNFDGSDDSILNGTPITEEYASKLFDSTINSNISDVGVVIKVKEVPLGDRTIVFYSDKTALVKYNNGEYMKVSPVNGKYGIDKNGTLDRNATTENVSGKLEENENLGITILYLSDGSMEVSKENSIFFVRNSDVTNNDNSFYTNLSGVSLPVNKDNGNTYYSDGTIKKANYIIVNGNSYGIKEKKNVYDNIKIIYYENGYAEIVKDNLSIMVKNSKHIVYSDSILEIIDNAINEIDIKDVMDIKEITLKNTNTETAHYIIVLEETDNYKKHNVNRRLANEFIRFNLYIDGNKIDNNILNNNLKESSKLKGVTLDNNTYLLYEGNIDKLSSASIKIGMWIDYEDITNEYMNSAFIGTVKVYIESLN